MGGVSGGGDVILAERGEARDQACPRARTYGGE